MTNEPNGTEPSNNTPGEQDSVVSSGQDATAPAGKGAAKKKSRPILKSILGLFGAAVLLLVIIVAGVFVYIDHLARVGVEHGASYALGVPTKVDSMDVEVFGGEVTIRGLEVSNPGGFTTPHFLKLDEGHVGVNLSTLREQIVVIPDFTLHSIDVQMEKRGDKSNYQIILNNLKRFQQEGAPPADDEPEADAKKFVVEKIAIDDIRVEVQLLPLGGDMTRIPIIIERIELENIGTDTDQGVVLSELTGIITRAILEAVLRAGAEVLPQKILHELGQGLEGLVGLGEGTVRLVGDVSTKIGGEIVKIGEFGAGAVLDLGTGVMEGGEAVFKATGEAVKKLGEGAKDIGEGAANVGKDVGKGLEDGAKKIGEGLDDAGKNIEEGIGGLLDGLGKKKKDDEEGE